MSLQPNKLLQKALLSTTSRFVGEYDNGGLLITHAWPDFGEPGSFQRMQEGPSSRNGLVLAFHTEGADHEGIVVPDYSPVGDIVSAYLSVLFGKRIDSHGLFECSGRYAIPNYSEFATLCDPRLPYNSHSPRADYPVPLNLVEVERIGKMLSIGSLDNLFEDAFIAATGFYARAVRCIERDPENAYLHLITVGEILSNAAQVDQEGLLDELTREDLRSIEEGLENGVAVANRYRAKLMSIKKRFVTTLVGLVDDSFFQRREAIHELGGVLQGGFERSIGAAYDLRSRFVHRGTSFGKWIRADVAFERQIGKPVGIDKDLSKILVRAPTLLGLERIIRYCLLRFAESNDAFQWDDSYYENESAAVIVTAGDGEVAE